MTNDDIVVILDVGELSTTSCVEFTIVDNKVISKTTSAATCQYRNCSEEVFLACPKCLIFLRYDHIATIAQCQSDHHDSESAVVLAAVPSEKTMSSSSRKKKTRHLKLVTK